MQLVEVPNRRVLGQRGVLDQRVDRRLIAEHRTGAGHGPGDIPDFRAQLGGAGRLAGNRLALGVDAGHRLALLVLREPTRFPADDADKPPRMGMINQSAAQPDADRAT